MAHTTTSNGDATTTVGKAWLYEQIRQAEEEAFDHMEVAHRYADEGKIEAACELLGITIRFLLAHQRKLAHEIFNP